MIKVTVLIPVTYNDGTIIPHDKIDYALRNLRSICGGFTIEGRVVGEYMMDDVTVSRDCCNKVWVVVDATKLNQLRDWASSLCHVCKQESIYFDIQDVRVEFVRDMSGMSHAARAADTEQSDREYIATQQRRECAS